VANNSDYKKLRTRIDKLLPAPYQSETNESIMENTFNRFLSKKETAFVDGYIGKRNTSAINSRQIIEDSIISQANQLQPIISAILGTEKRYMSWVDVINELEEQGVDMEQFSEWGKTEKYNWVPPIDIDKLIHFRDYFWVNPDANSTPEYITIKSVLNEARVRLSTLRNIAERYGETFPIIGLREAEPTQTFTIASIDATNNTVTVAGDASNIISDGDYITIRNTVSNNGQVKLITSPVYVSGSNVTTLSVEANSIVGNEVIGQVLYFQFNGFEIADDFTLLFENGFVAFVKDTDNEDLNGSFISVSNSELISDSTVIEIDRTFTDVRTGGIISLVEQISIAAGVVACESGETSTYDTGLWDDNSSTTDIWNGSYNTLIANISNTDDPSAPGTDGELWYATDSDTLFKYDSSTWKVIYNNFSLVLDSVTNSELLDFSEDCSTEVPQAESQWSMSNSWVHRADVENFASARQANYPIIEFFRGLELNEYLEVNHNWRYRSGASGVFNFSEVSPTLFELIDFDLFVLSNGNTEIILDHKFGDVTDTFVTGYIFSDSSANELIVESSEFKYNTNDKEWNTIVTTTTPVDASVTAFQPKFTVHGDEWIGYDTQWVYGGILNEVPSISIPRNFLNDIDDDATEFPFPPNHPITGLPTGPLLYSYVEGKYAQKFIVADASNRTFEFANSNLRDKIILDQNDLRVYLNGVRLYGGYSEIEDTATNEFVIGIEVDSDVVLSTLDEILIEIGTSALEDHGLTNIRVRTIENDSEYTQTPFNDRKTLISAVRYKKTEQIKTETNQYPQFSLYNVDGTNANIAAPLFAFKTNQEQTIATELGLRVEVDSLTENYTFEQSLISDSNQLYAYATTPTNEYWVGDSVVYKNNNGVWNDKFVQGDTFKRAIVSNETPDVLFDGLVWFSPNQEKLFIYEAGNFVEITSVEISISNPAISTIWKKANNDYVPVKKDWNGRTQEEYNIERVAYTTGQTELLKFNNPTFTDEQVDELAQTMWLTSQQNNLSETGEWIGDWTLPDYFYFNVQNENRKEITTRELVGHFESIINSQNRVAGYVGDLRSQYHTLQQEDIDLGIGGKIHQYNNNFSTFISSVFVDNIIIPNLFEFAQNQYQILLDDARDISIANITQTLTEIPESEDIENILISKNVADRSLNSNLEFIYGDSTVFDISTGEGVRNWIATLPNIGILPAIQPSTNVDPVLDLYELVHHDGHRVNYALSTSKKDELFDTILNFYTNNPSQGTVQTTTPATNVTDLVNVTTLEDFVGGYYWIDTSTKKLYFAYVDFIQSGSVAIPDTIENTFWFDTDTSVVATGELKYSDGVAWNVVPVASAGDLINGTSIELSSVSIWREIDLNELVLNSILDIENRLYDKSKEIKNGDFAVTSNLEEYFLGYTKNIGDELPFLNTDYDATDPFSWNYKSSVFGNSYSIQAIDLTENAFIVSGTVATIFSTSPFFYIKNSGNNDGLWTVNVSLIDEDLSEQTTKIVVNEPITSVDTGLLYKGSLPSPSTNTGAESAVYWKALYQQFYNTPYPNLEPWKLQGYDGKPTWWDDEYKNTDPTVYGSRRWKHINGVGMWSNIGKGIVPTSRLLPNGNVSTGVSGEVTQYDYFSVNVGDVAVSSDSVNFYEPDDLYPPYFDYISAGIPSITDNKSLFNNFSFEILNPSDNYVFGENSSTEYEWRNSSQFLYDYAVQSYIESPIYFVTNTFGFETITIDGLLIDTKTKNVPSYKRTTFHGSLDDDDQIVKFNGINQWYINYNRYTNVDTNASNFYQLWTTWNAPLSYRFNSFIDVRTLDISNQQISVESNIDYSVHIKKTNGVKSFSINGLSTTLLGIPPKVINYDNSHLWKIQVSNNSTRNNSISYYGVKNYPFYADVETNTMKIYTYKIRDIELIRKTIELDNDLTDVFKAKELATFSSGSELEIFAVSYNESDNKTVLYFNDDLSSITVGELVSADVTTLPWETGDSVWFTTERKLPAPLFGDTPPIGPIQYFIIKLSDTEFRVAETERTAIANLPITLVNSGTSVHYVGEIVNTFIVGNSVNTDNYWRHYQLDTRIEKTINMPGVINGVQEYINVVDGYVEKLREEGFTFSDDTFGWQNQIERFIDYSFSVRQKLRNRTIGNRFQVKPDVQTNTWSWVDGFVDSPIPNGYAVNVVSKTGTGLPAPFLPKIPYYIIINLDGTFSLANSVNKASAGIPITLLDNGSANEIELYAAVDNVTRYPKIEVNTFKDRLSFMPPFGVVSDVIKGPFSDINVANSLRDQYGDPLLISDFIINRHDKKTDIQLTTIRRIDDTTVVDEIDDLGSEGYHYISAATFYVDTYEHIVEFEDYTNDDDLLYDGFVGLNIQRFNIDFNRPDEKTLRPNIGGSTIISEGRNLSTIDNIERMVDDLRYAYGSVAENESNRYAPYARETLGYNENSTESYLNSIDINEKSQFLFWQGLIQVKGSTRSIDSFINSKKFIDAQIDEFWAYEIADFGSVEEQEFPQVFINTGDVVDNNVKFEFIEGTEVAKPGYEISTYGIGGYDIITSADQIDTGEFIAISLNDSSRWYKQPDQANILEDNGLVIYFESAPVGSMEVTLSDYIGQPTPTITHNFMSDNVVIVVEFPEVGIDSYTVGDGFAAGDTTLKLRNRYIPFVGQTKVFKNGIVMQTPSDYSDVNQSSSILETVDEIFFSEPLLATDKIEVSYGNATLNSSIQYEVINSNIVRFANDEIFTFASKMTIWNLQSNFEAHNASKLIDIDSDVVVSNINLFDPARGIYNQQAFNDVDIITDIPPAFFNRTERTKIEPERPEGFVTKEAWSAGEVGKIWLDTKNLAYIPYYDESIFRTTDERLEQWGKQAEYSSFKVYEWVESDVHPEDYAELVEDEQGNTEIPEHLQKSGTPKETIFLIILGPAPDFTIEYQELVNYVIDYSVVIDGTEQTFGEYQFTVPVDFLQADHFGIGNYNVYVNGIFRQNELITQTDVDDIITVTNLRESDTVQIVHDYNVDEDTLEAAAEEEIIRRSYEYTEVESFTSLGEPITKYYFWVEDKLTRAQDNDLSAKEIENSWTFINRPYLVLQNPTPATRNESTIKENVDVDFSFSIKNEHFVDDVQYLQIGQQQDSYSNASGITPNNGTYAPGIGYQPDDIIELTGGVLVRVISSDGNSSGEITDFEIVYNGDIQPNIGDTLIQLSSSQTSGTGFELSPSISNFGGFILRLGSDMESFDDVTGTTIDSSDTLLLTINGDVISERSEITKSGEYIILDKRSILVTRSVNLNDTVAVSYESNKPSRIDELPVRYTRAVIRNVGKFIQEDNRYTIRFRKDFTDDSKSDLDNKKLHKQWSMFRENQQSKIDRYLWDKVTESMVGHELENPSSIIPSIARQLYDTQNNDTTRYGLGNGQAFTNGTQALTTLLADINDVENEFRGVDVASFLTLNSFDTPDDIITSMDLIYSTFPVEDVNRMFFLFLNDALSNKTEYAKLLKTSMISVYGVKVLDTKEAFDE